MTVAPYEYNKARIGTTYNGIGTVTIEGVIDTPLDVRDTYLNLRVNADRLTTPDRSSRPVAAAECGRMFTL